MKNPAARFLGGISERTGLSETLHMMQISPRRRPVSPGGVRASRPQAARGRAMGEQQIHRSVKFFALELKKLGGRASEAQLAFISDMEAAGGFCAVAEGLDRALATLEAWGLLRGKAS
jgi:hypothetical protein